MEDCLSYEPGGMHTDSGAVDGLAGGRADGMHRRRRDDCVDTVQVETEIQDFGRPRGGGYGLLDGFRQPQS